MRDFLHSQGMIVIMIDGWIQISGIQTHIQFAIEVSGIGKGADTVSKLSDEDDA